MESVLWFYPSSLCYLPPESREFRWLTDLFDRNQVNLILETPEVHKHIITKKVSLRQVVVRTLLILFLCSLSAQAQTATVTWGTTHQTIQGFGASNHAQGAQVNPYDTLFFQTLGYSILRVGLPSDGSCTSISSACAQDADHNSDSLTDMHACIANGCQIFVTGFTPPAIYKTNNSITCAASPSPGTLAAGDYSLYATYISNFIASLQTEVPPSIPVYAFSVQNEPTVCSKYDSAELSASAFDTFIKTNLGPTICPSGPPCSPLIMMPDSNGYASFTASAGTCMADSSCAKYVGINAFHGYDNSFSISNPYSSQNKQFWETEASGGSGGIINAPGCTDKVWCPGISDAMFWANVIDYNIAVANENAWLWWAMTPTNSSGDNEPLIYDGTVAIRAYVIGQYAKFIRPGWVRIDATHAPQSKVTVSAYKNAAGAFAIVATNQNASNVSQTFSLNGFSVTSVTPWVTSGSLSLAQQSDVAVGGDSFSYTLPAYSVTTLVGVIVAPPTELTSKVQ